MKQLLLFAFLLLAGWQGYSHFSGRSAPVESLTPGVARTVQAPTTELGGPPGPTFACDGRIHCTQMGSRAEAAFFVRHCPQTRMDGDRDGEPCESDSRI